MTHSTTVRRGSISLITSVLGAGFIAGIIPAGLLPANVLNIEQSYGLSHAEMGRIVGLCMIIGGASGGLLGGWVCGRIGALRNLLLSLAMAVAALGSIGFIHSLHATVIGLGGYFFAMGFMGSSNALAAHMLPDRQRGVAMLHALNAVGKLAGPILASLFLYGAWRSSFIAAAALPLMLALPAILAYRGGGDISIGRKRQGDGRPGVFFWTSVAGFALIAGSEIAVALWIPTYAQKARGFSAAEGNTLLSLFLIGMIAGRFVSGALSRRLTSRTAIGICGALVVFAVPAVLMSGFSSAAGFFLLFGLAFSAVWPSYFAHLTHVFPAHLGLMGGAAVFSTQIGFALCSYTSGRLADIHLAYPILFGAIVMGVFTIAFFISPIGRSAKGAQS